MRERQRTPLDDLDLEVVRLIGKTPRGRLAYAADAVVDGDREAARARAGDQLAGVLRSPLGLWAPVGPDTAVWVTETLERGTPDGQGATVGAASEYVATVDELSVWGCRPRGPGAGAET